jgi:C-terminal processing protease CtpA/Prc
MKRTLVLLLFAALAVGSARLLPASAAAPQLSGADAGELSTSYTYLTENFYKKVDPQAVLDSVRLTLLSAMRTAGVKHAELPAMHAAATGTNVREIDHEIADAAKESTSKLTVHDLSYIALDGMMRSVNDRYTVFLSPKEFAGLNQGLDGGDFGGTGIVIQVDDKTKYISVENVVPDAPADKAGIRQDDLITTIDGTSTKGMSLPTASGKLRGKEGTHVTLTVSRDGAGLASPITITRAKIHQLSVYEKMLPGKIGYVALTGSTPRSIVCNAMEREL